MFEQEEPGVSNSGGADGRSLFGTRQLLVVSNRQPYQHERSPAGELAVDRPVGGLTASLDPMMQRTGGTWIAWGEGDADREVVDGSDCVEVPPEDPQYTLRRVWLTDDQVEGYYYGFSNQVLWPLCHSSLATVEARPAYWQQYRRTNEQFAGAIVEEAGEQPVIWLHDYHLALASQRVRRELGGSPLIMQFWHIPWPSWDVFRACPHREEILEGLLGNDMLGFHVQRYANNFLECVDAAFNEATINWQSGDVSYHGGITRVESTPMGVPFKQIQQKAAAHHRSDFRGFRRSHGIDTDTRIAVGVDRLDYSKGIPERLRALETLWERYPEWQESLTCVQNGSDSRSEIPAYKALQEEVDGEIERINERFGTEDWQPIVPLSEHLSQQELYGLYRYSDVGIVSSIRDGLNLVAAEYAAAQVGGNGVLVLSTQTGAHDLFGESAVSVTPLSVGQFADRLNEALTMPPAERRSRMEHIQRVVANNNLWSWLQQNESTAQAVGRARLRTV